jgi:hypothetical protein
MKAVFLLSLLFYKYLIDKLIGAEGVRLLRDQRDR